jgi:transcriptional regulator with XRE-family HTH domain
MDHRTLRVADRLKAAASQKNVSIQQLSKTTGIGYGTLQGILTGAREPRMTHLFLLADAIGINVADLIEASAA